MGKKELPENNKEQMKFWEDGRNYSDLNNKEVQITMASFGTGLKGDKDVVESIKVVGDYSEGNHFTWFNGSKL